VGYLKISNLYKNKEILLFKQAYAMEKVHGTSTHVRYKPSEDRLIFFSGGCKQEHFMSLFNQEELLAKFRENAKAHPDADITIYGEGYGGNMQSMSKTYGNKLCFIAFEVKINDDWLGVQQAETIATQFGFEFVPYKIIDTTEEAINAEMMADSEVAVRRGMGLGRMREGIVLRPLVELVHPNGGRVISKHKRPEFSEREHTPKFTDPDELKVLEDARAIADEWCTEMRLVHVLDKFPDASMENTKDIILAMQKDIEIEAKGEIVESKEFLKAVATKTAKLFKQHLNKLGQ
jgi:hypothetical protein